MVDRGDEIPEEDGPDVQPDPPGQDGAPGASPQGDAAEPELTVEDILRQAQEAGGGQGQGAGAGQGEEAGVAGADAPSEPASPSSEATDDDARLADLESTLLNDLKRLQAEYANYRRRTEEQRHIEVDRAKGEVAKGLLPVLDDLDRADKHGDLEEGSAFAVIAEKIRGVALRTGVVAYGAAGEAFDPQHHEAIFQQPTPGVAEPTILEVVEVGYRIGDVELRPAKVVVAVPADGAETA